MFVLGLIWKENIIIYLKNDYKHKLFYIVANDMEKSITISKFK
jgi:hypothetical protein